MCGTCSTRYFVWLDLNLGWGEHIGANSPKPILILGPYLRLKFCYFLRFFVFLFHVNYFIWSKITITLAFTLMLGPWFSYLHLSGRLWGANLGTNSFSLCSHTCSILSNHYLYFLGIFTRFVSNTLFWDSH